MKSKFADEEKESILKRYLSKCESKRKGFTLRNFTLLEAKVKRLEWESVLYNKE